MSTFLLATEAATEAVRLNEVLTADGGVLALAWLIPALPLLGFALVLLLRPRLKEHAAYIAVAMSAGSFVMSVAVFLAVRDHQAAYIVEIFDWIDVGGFTVSFDLLVDQLTAVLLLVVTGVGTLVHIYSLGYMYGDERYERFFAYLNLFLFSMLMLVLGSNLLGLFLGWELVGLSSYLLIGFWFEDMHNAVAAKKAFITNRVGDVSFMVAMFYAFSKFGTLDFVGETGILEQAHTVLTSDQAFILGILLLGGAVAKSAQIPLYVWLPDAMAGPTPVSALIHAATMVTAGVYLMVRMSPVLVESLDLMVLISWIGAGTALMAALIALRQDDYKKILAYSTVSQLGYMFIGVGTGGFSEGIFHLFTHAMFKGLLFLAAGSVMHAFANRTDIWRMGGVRKVMPITFATSAIAWLAISGIPPFAGFFSKDQILTTAYEHGFTGVWAVGLATAAITAFYMSRWFFLLFLGEPRWTEGETVVDPHGHGETSLHPHESESTMTFPLIVLAVMSAGAGLLNFTHYGLFYTWLKPVTALSKREYFEHGPLTEPMLIAASVAAAALGIGGAYLAYVRRDVSHGKSAEVITGLPAELLERKFFVDELYQTIFVRAGSRVANSAAWFDRTVVDGLVNGAGASARGVATIARRAQTGVTRSYVGTMIVGGLVLVLVLLSQVV
ncbi:MAG: NADH-quinone oxidoreductase subunit L [Nitriliruptoraceae bacterium]|jgi:NADH-quinone oxidoreductase subunit L